MREASRVDEKVELVYEGFELEDLRVYPLELAEFVSSPGW